MADEFDPLKQSNTKPPEQIYATIQKNIIRTNDDDLLRSPFENILKLGAVPTNQSTEAKPQTDENYQKLNYTETAHKIPTRSTNPFAEDIQKPPIPSKVVPSASQGHSSTSDESYWENTNEYYDQNYHPGPPSAYYPEEYYDHRPSIRKGFASAIDRLVNRFPLLGVFYKQPPGNILPEQETEYVEEEEEEGDEPPQLVDANATARELTADELELNKRYSDKQRVRIISLQNKDQTQPVDVCVHHDTHILYSCDVGRSVIEIFDQNGKLKHVIDDPTTTKLQPTSIAITFDGTIIVSSHFQHRLQMYSPMQNENEHVQEHNYNFKQYRLGSPGHNVHQFHHPAGVAINLDDGYLYVCDRGNYRIQILRPEGICERVVDLVLQDEDETPIPPIQVALQRNGNQMICLVGTGDAICFIPKNTDGPIYVEPLYILDNDGLGLEGASGLAVDANDRIFISDTGHHRIMICTPEGYYITHIGIEGNGPGELKRPCGLDVTNDGTIIIADSGNKRLQLFGTIPEQDHDDKNILLIDPDIPAM